MNFELEDRVRVTDPVSCWRGQVGVVTEVHPVHGITITMHGGYNLRRTWGVELVVRPERGELQEAEEDGMKFKIGQVVYERGCFSQITGHSVGGDGANIVYYMDGDSSDPVPESEIRELTVEEMFG